MVTLRLFHATDPFRPITQRVLGAGELSIGRDPAADWPIEDQACELSRRHCRIRVSDLGVFVRDTSANGVFLGPARQRPARDAEVRLEPDEALYLGQFLITLDMGAMTIDPIAANDHAAKENGALDAPFHLPILHAPVLSASDFQISGSPLRESERKSAGAAARACEADAPWLEAFCEGAGIDPSCFAGEDGLAVARRAGAAYRQTVAGLCDLMGERSALKADYRMSRTTVSSRDNNPFKWADAHQVAVDLLRSGNAPFLSGAAAVRASFEDMKRHLLCLLAGSRAAVQASFDATSPKAIEQTVEGKPVLFKAEACWRAYLEVHAEASSSAAENAQSAVNQAFKAGYEDQARKLDALSTVS